MDIYKLNKKIKKVVKTFNQKSKKAIGEIKMTKYLRGTQEEDEKVLIQEVLDSASDQTFINILGEPKLPKEEQLLNKTQLAKVLKEVAICLELGLSIVKTIIHVKNAVATQGIQLEHKDVRTMRKMIMDEYNKRFLSEGEE